MAYTETSTTVKGPLAYMGQNATMSDYAFTPEERERYLSPLVSGVRDSQELLGDRYREIATRAGLDPSSGAMQGVVGSLLRQTGSAETDARNAAFNKEQELRAMLTELQNRIETTRIGSAAGVQSSKIGAGATLGAARIGAGAQRYATDKSYDIANRGMLLDEANNPFTQLNLYRSGTAPYSVDNPSMSYGQTQPNNTLSNMLSLGGNALGAYGAGTGTTATPTPAPSTDYWNYTPRTNYVTR